MYAIVSTDYLCEYAGKNGKGEPNFTSRDELPHKGKRYKTHERALAVATGLDCPCRVVETLI